jgi:hypothetical protein
VLDHHGRRVRRLAVAHFLRSHGGLSIRCSWRRAARVLLRTVSCCVCILSSVRRTGRAGVIIWSREGEELELLSVISEVVNEFLISLWTCNVGCCRALIKEGVNLLIRGSLESGHCACPLIRACRGRAKCRQFGSSYV